MDWKALIGALIIGILLLIIEYRTGFFHPTDSKRDRSILGRIIEALKPKPRLGITVRDINCYARTLTKHTYAGHAQASLTVAEWWVELTAKIENRGKAKATNVQWQAKLIFEQEEGAFSLEAEVPRRSFNLTTREVHPFVIRFRCEELSQEECKLYPSSLYRLEFTYSCTERSRSRKATASGKLTKADWVILSSIDALEPQRFIRNVGFQE